MGYMHRGYEKLTEVRTYPQVTTLINRIDWLGSFANEVPFILAAEQLMEVEAPPRAQWIRTILFELSRIANVTLFLGDMGVQLGALTPVFYAFRDREYVLNLIESVTGGRFHPNFDRIGGLKDDLPKGWIDETKAVMVKIRDFCDEIEDLLIGNEIFQTRTRGIGVIPADVGLAYGLSGANIRASGVDWDLRRDSDVGLAWTSSTGRSGPIPTATRSPATGCACRRPARRRTSSTSSSTASRPGRSWPRCPASSRCPPARRGSPPRTRSARWATTSSARATSGRSGSRSARPAFNNISITPWLLKGVYVPDVITILASPVLHPRRHRPLMVGRSSSPTSPTGARRCCACSACCSPCCIPAGTIVYLYLFKVVSFMQSRLGPMEAGPYGSMQLFAEVGKFLQKEDLFPERADRRVFAMAPIVVLISTFLIFLAVPFGPDAVFADYSTGIFFALAVSSISVLGILMAGWSSANKYSLMGGPAGRGPAHRLRAADGARRRRRRDPGRHAQPATDRRRPGRRRDLRLERHRQPVRPHAVRRRSSSS